MSDSALRPEPTHVGFCGSVAWIPAPAVLSRPQQTNFEALRWGRGALALVLKLEQSIASMLTL